MTIPLWTLVIATLLPYFWFGLANPLRRREFGSVDNHHPRLQQAKQTEKGARVTAASGNAFEALSVYAPAVIVAYIRSPDSVMAVYLSIAWVVLRTLHGIAYIADKPAPRTAFFALGSLCALGMYLVGAQVL